MLDNAGGGSTGSSLGSVIAKATRPKSTGASVGRTVIRSTGSRSSSGGSSSNKGKTTSRRVTSTSSRRITSGGGGGGGSSNPGKSRGSGAGSAASKVLQPPSINSYLGTDSAYQQSLSGGKRSLADYLSELNRRRGESTTQYTQTKGNMERDRTQQLSDLQNEFASRGLIQSGLYGQEQGKFQQQFQDQSTALDQQQAGLVADLLSQEKNYRREQDLSNQTAKQEALQRRAAKYKIGS